MQMKVLTKSNAFTGQKSQVGVIFEDFAVMLSGCFLAVSSGIKMFHMNRIHRSIFI